MTVPPPSRPSPPPSSPPAAPPPLTAAERARRRRRVRRVLFWIAALAAIVLAVWLIRCGGGFGFGDGDGLGTGSGAATGSGRARGLAQPARCALRVEAAGVLLDGAPTTVAAAVAACQATTGADVVVAGDARQGTWDELRAALDAAGVPSLVRGAGAPPAVDAGP